ncbi:MAG: sulfotransferase [Proteobacteria bacterium]|nr:sulfotransferase [Pseudomonadota bacterium]
MVDGFGVVTIDIGQTLAWAAAHWTAGQANQAEMACQQVLAAWPGQCDAMHLLGIMAHAFGNLDLSVSHLRRACEAPRAPAVYFANFAEMCRQKGLHAEGEQAARRAVTLDPQLPGGWNNLGIILQEQGRFEESRQALSRALAWSPNDAHVHNNLANTSKRMGLIADAERHWARAIELAPDYPEPHSNLASLLTEQGEFDRAEQMARRAIELNPQMADAYLNLAGVAVARQRYPEAHRWLMALAVFAPDHVGGLAAQAHVMKELGELAPALAVAQRAVALAPNDAQAHDALGHILQADNQYVAALAAFRKAAELPGTVREKALVDQGVLHAAFGHKDRALDAFDAALADFPASATAWFNRADLYPFPRDDPAIGRMVDLLEQRSVSGASLSNRDRMLLNFAGGKAFLDTGESARAFRYLDAGNRMKRALISYDADAVAAWMARLARDFDAGLLAAKAGQGAPSTMPVFIVGMPRSGTTLLEQILASHPDIHGAGELTHIQRLADTAGPVIGLDAERLAAMGREYLSQVERLAAGRRHIVDKMPSNFLHAGLIRLTLPDARIIHCRRDPVDTCLSCYSKLFTTEQSFTYEMTELGRFHRGYRELMAHWRAVLPASHFLEVDYEAVVADMPAEVRRILDFLGLEWDDACRNFHRTQRPVLTASVNRVREPLYATAVGRWRAHALQLRPLLDALGVVP